MNIQIKDIYAGKPDAKDEIESGGMNPFLENYVMPDNFNLDSLVNGTQYFITGYKGTGKTALLYYLDDYIKKLDAQSNASFIFFKEGYSDSKKQELEILSKRLTSAISIGNNVVLDGNDFEYIWRWLFYQRIIADNEEYNDAIFVNDDKWQMFVKTIGRIGLKNHKKRFLSIPSKITLSVPYVDLVQQASIEPTLELDFSNEKSQDTDSYKCFIAIIDEADELFKGLTRTEIPYYIFVDELEAYYGEEKIFKRDLMLIRDLMFTVKKVNSAFLLQKHAKTKIICSVRTEILNAINRFVVTKELNKIISGYEVPLIWDYTNTNSFSHPILKILLKRIEYAEKNAGVYITEKKLIENWFPEKINNNEPSNYLLNNSWCKPRDMVRLILAAQSCLGSSNSSFSQATIDLCHKKYSTDSLVEIKEEMRALYSPEDVNTIFNCLTGFRALFTVEELKNHINKYFSNTLLERKLDLILSDLYRLGIIGNYSPSSKSYRWQHKGDDGIILTDEWKIMIHRALQSSLSVTRKHDRANMHKSKGKLEKGQIVKVRVSRIIQHFALVEIEMGDGECNGSIHISELSDKYQYSVDEVVSVGDVCKARVLEYDEKHRNWLLSLRLEDN